MLTSVAAAAVRWQQHQQQQSRQQQQLQQQHQQATELTFAAVAAATAAATAVVAATAAGELARLVGGLAHIIATDRLLFSCICIQYAKVHTGTLPDPTGVAGEFWGGTQHCLPSTIAIVLTTSRFRALPNSQRAWSLQGKNLPTWSQPKGPMMTIKG